eukprot:CAMPEP_0206049134 /NCGR_PEP_ID=MMETSP1466-20131121/26043_1 /ASSEMBLY_ACC=CAM_ASM_001126 /TAXON_ID=44452 /ORGANISM="Pavlova gyrans, Strain CCMP608" /LENGTH=1171 /DNA_ID=CAMNT_0053424217 /DNA_START=35 /DNA_END=3550 /DNA_ORIENTATION=+
MAFQFSSKKKRSTAPPKRFVLITDPGPDPDDVKALLALSVLHKQGIVRLEAVVANGGQQPDKRARLAKCILNHVKEPNVPVGIGSQGKPYSAQPHEYDMEGYEEVEQHDLGQGPSLLLRVLRDAPPKSLNFVCISSLRDLADLMVEHPDLVREKTQLVAIQGGLEKKPAPVVEEEDGDERGNGTGPAEAPATHEPITDWIPDSSVNNGFDMEGAAIVYSFCFEHGVPMNVVSRNAVPLLPMQLARSFAQRCECPVMSYLANAQFMGLEGLWQKICAGLLPPRCTKQWYFETFCGISKEDFKAKGFDELGGDAPIKQHLNGFVKPYDVIALMTALPPVVTHSFPRREAAHRVRGVKHHLFLEASHMIMTDAAVQLLRYVYHEVVLATRTGGETQQRSTNPFGSFSGRPTSRLSVRAIGPALRSLVAGRRSRGAPYEEGRDPSGAAGVGGPPAPLVRDTSRVSDISSSSSRIGRGPAPIDRLRESPQQSTADGLGARNTFAQAPSGGMTVRRVPGQPVAEKDVAGILEYTLEQAVRLQAKTSERALVVGCVLCAAAVVAIVVDVDLTARRLARVGLAPFDDKGHLIRLSLYNIPLISAFPVWLLALHPSEEHRVLMHGSSLAIMLLAVAASIGNAATVAPEAAYYSVAELAWFGLHVILVAVGGVAQFASMRASAELPPRRLLHNLWRTIGVLLIAYFGTTLGFYCAAAATSPRYAAPGEWTGIGGGALAGLFAADVFHCAYGILVGCCAAHPGFQRRAQTRLSRAVGAPGTLAPLAPLLGLGTTAEADPKRVAEEALRVCEGVVLDDDLSTLLPEKFLLGRDGSQPASRASSVSAWMGSLSRGGSRAASRAPSRGASVAPSPCNSRQASMAFETADVAVAALLAANSQTLSRGLRPVAKPARLQMAAAGAQGSQSPPTVGSNPMALPLGAGGQPRWAGPSRAPSHASAGSTASLAPRAAGRGALWPYDEHTIDVYVVHSPMDDAFAKARALHTYRQRFVEEHNRFPVIWLDTVCTNPSLRPFERLQHLPVYLSRSRRILALAGTHLVDSLQVVVELYAWTLVGGSLHDVDFAVLGGADEGQRAIAAFDAFHVMWVDQATEGTQDTRTRLIRVVEMATVNGFNEVIRSYLPFVRGAVEKADADAAAGAGGGVGEEGEEQGADDASPTMPAGNA